MPDEFLDADRIRASTFVRHVEIHDTLGSTNGRARELALNPDVELPALIVARIQTAGRGRGKNVWHSTEGALTFSVLIDASKLQVPNTKRPLLSLTTAVALCDAISKETTDEMRSANPQIASLGIKWPNDVMLHGAKLAGILIESPAAAESQKQRLVIGVGVNVNNAFPGDNAAQRLPRDSTGQPLNAISLRDATCRMHDLNRILCEFLSAAEIRISQLESNDAGLQADWSKLDWLLAQRVEVQSNGHFIDGICTGIDHDGALVVKNALGEHAIHSGSVKLRS